MFRPFVVSLSNHALLWIAERAIRLWFEPLQRILRSRHSPIHGQRKLTMSG
jgi:hypothetical protein